MKTPQSPAPVAGRPLTAEDVALLRKGDVIEYISDALAPTGTLMTVTAVDEEGIDVLDRGTPNSFFRDTVEGSFRLSRPASEQPVEAIGAGRRELLERLEAEVSDETMRALLSCKDVGSGRAHLARIIAALSPASPARTPMGGPQVLKGVGKINGDGWKDTTTIGEVVYVWNAEKPSPYAPGQYPRIDNEGWSASTAQYDFSPASVDEVRALAAPTPMGGDREHSSRCWGRTSFSDEVLHCYCQTAPTPMGGEDIGEEYEVAAHCVTLAECPPGLFFWNGTIGFKSEYGAMEPAGDGGKAWRVGNRPDAYCADSGEFFWGGSSTHEDRAKVLVMPINAQTVAMVASHGPEALAKSTPMGWEVEALREALMAAQSFIADGGLAESEPGASIYRQITQALEAK